MLNTEEKDRLAMAHGVDINKSFTREQLDEIAAPSKFNLKLHKVTESHFANRRGSAEEHAWEKQHGNLLNHINEKLRGMPPADIHRHVTAFIDQQMAAHEHSAINKRALESLRGAWNKHMAPKPKQ